MHMNTNPSPLYLYKLQNRLIDMKTIEINGTAREDLGTKSAKANKNQGLIPCVLYGGKENLHFTLSKQAVKPLVYTATLHKAQITIGDKSYEAIVKDFQFHPLTDELTHLDFQELVPGKQVLIDIPIKIKGTAKGVKMGGKLMEKMRYVRVKCTPEHLVGNIEINVKKLTIGQSVRVRDIDLEGIQVMDPESNPIVTVIVTRAAKAAASVEEG